MIQTCIVVGSHAPVPAGIRFALRQAPAMKGLGFELVAEAPPAAAHFLFARNTRLRR